MAITVTELPQYLVVRLLSLLDARELASAALAGFAKWHTDLAVQATT